MRIPNCSNKGSRGRTFDLLQVIKAGVQDLQVRKRVQAPDFSNLIAVQVQLRQRYMNDVSVDRLEEVITETERLNIRVIQHVLKSTCIPEHGYGVG